MKINGKPISTAYLHPTASSQTQLAILQHHMYSSHHYKDHQSNDERSYLMEHQRSGLKTSKFVYGASSSPVKKECKVRPSS